MFIVATSIRLAYSLGVRNFQRKLFMYAILPALKIAFVVSLFLLVARCAGEDSPPPAPDLRQSEQKDAADRAFDELGRETK